MWHSFAGPEAHVLFETLAYLAGAQLYWRGARHEPHPAAGDPLLLLGGALLGAMLGSKLLHVMEHLPALLEHHDLALWLAGKSVLGGFLGGTLGVELAKRATGWSRPTGDPWVPALAAGLIIGRMGCQLSGTWDLTYGTPTNLPWAWDYGDGIGRHPTALYEMMLVAFSLVATSTPALTAYKGARFAAFLLLYCAIRFALEFLKPPFGAAAEGALPVASYLTLTAIQWAAIAGGAWYLWLLNIRLRAESPT